MSDKLERLFSRERADLLVQRMRERHLRVREVKKPQPIPDDAPATFTPYPFHHAFSGDPAEPGVNVGRAPPGSAGVPMKRARSASRDGAKRRRTEDAVEDAVEDALDAPLAEFETPSVPPETPDHIDADLLDPRFLDDMFSDDGMETGPPCTHTPGPQTTPSHTPEATPTPTPETVTLSAEQEEVVDLLVHGTRHVFLTGKAGTGKTLVVTEAVRRLKAAGVLVETTASTAMAAALVEGRTVHGWSGSLADVAGWAETLSEAAGERIIKCEVLVVDEVSTLSALYVQELAKACRSCRTALRASALPQYALFGGIRVVLVGDFLQLPPVRWQDTPGNDLLYRSAFWARLEPHVDYAELTRVFRQADPGFTRMLAEVRTGQLSDASWAIIDEASAARWPAGTESVHLKLKRKDVDAHNTRKLDALPGAVHTIRAIDRSPPRCDPAWVASFHANTRTEETLRLKVGARVMCIRNLDKHVFNGSIGTVTRFDGEAPIVRYDSGVERTMRRHDYREETKHRGKVVAATRRQVPLILGWAFTVHKAQGQTFDRVTADVRGAWETGHVYVALSRTRTREGLHIPGGIAPRDVRVDHGARAFHQKVADAWAQRAEHAARAQRAQHAGSPGRVRRGRPGSDAGDSDSCQAMDTDSGHDDSDHDMNLDFLDAELGPVNTEDWDF